MWPKQAETAALHTNLRWSVFIFVFSFNRFNPAPKSYCSRIFVLFFLSLGCFICSACFLGGGVCLLVCFLCLLEQTETLYYVQTTFQQALVLQYSDTNTTYLWGHLSSKISVKLSCRAVRLVSHQMSLHLLTLSPEASGGFVQPSVAEFCFKNKYDPLLFVYKGKNRHTLSAVRQQGELVRT